MLANDAEFLLEVNGMCSVVNTNNYTYFPNSAFILDCENKYLEGEKENLRDTCIKMDVLFHIIQFG